jgi:hypothetical protein
MFSKALLYAGFTAAVQAVSFTVKSSGGNATSPYAYGLMFEVQCWRSHVRDNMLTYLGHQQQR